jgi:enediyne biosynthesis protein E4
MGTIISGCRRELQAGMRKLPGPQITPASEGPIFSVVSAGRSGITWVHDSAMSRAHYLPESMTGGCAFLDYDNDGWMDIFLVNTGPCDFFHPDPRHRPRNALYRNNRNGTFTDVTERAGLEGLAFGEGVAVGDYDGDGFPDLYLTAYGHNALFHNKGDGTFTDVTGKAGVADPNWSTSAVWFDYDNDGKLDLFVCNFVEYDPANRLLCGTEHGRPFYCIPRLFKPRASKLYHNNGDGTFTEVGHLTAIGKKLGKAHGVVATDINNDGFMDLFVTNDTVPNFLFLNRGNGNFEEVGLFAGVAFSEDGRPRSSMGVDSADYDNDGRADFFVANIDHEYFSLYHNDGQEMFTDKARDTGIAPYTRLLSGWGLKFFDYDNDGNLDLIIANGHPDDKIAENNLGVTWAEPLMLFQGDGGRKFLDVSAQAGPAFSHLWPSRGLAIGDFDNDGGIDVLINKIGQAPLLLHNEVGKRNNWLGVHLLGRTCNIDAVGASLRWSFNGQNRCRIKVGGGSFLASHDPRVVLGIGQSRQIDFLEIQWPQPSGKTERFTDLPLNTYITIEEGKGIRR